MRCMPRPYGLNLNETIDYYLARSYIVNKNGCMKIKENILNHYNTFGYPRIRFKNKNLTLPREIIKKIFGKKITKEIVTRHICNNPWCVNQEHLFYGSPKDNTGDILKAGRRHNTKGEKNGKAKINEETAKEIKNLLKENVSAKEIANKFNITKKIVFHIKYGAAWSWI